MGANSKIEWTDHTFNPWYGCTHVSDACQFCYAESLAKRRRLADWGANAPRKLNKDEAWDDPRKWNKAALKRGERYRVFCASMADVFDDHKSIKPHWRARLWDLIAKTPHLDWLLLTKRPHNWLRYLPVEKCRPPFTHVRLGVTIEDEDVLASSSTPLRRARDQGWETFVTYEPALELVDWRPMFEREAIGWMIAGGESGPSARMSNPDWFRRTRDQCKNFDVPFFFKQWGEWAPITDSPEDTTVLRIGKEIAGRLLDGVPHDDRFPDATPIIADAGL